MAGRRRWYPGTFSAFQWPTRAGIGWRSRVPGLMWDILRSASPLRLGAKDRYTLLTLA